MTSVLIMIQDTDPTVYICDDGQRVRNYRHMQGHGSGSAGNYSTDTISAEVAGANDGSIPDDAHFDPGFTEPVQRIFSEHQLQPENVSPQPREDRTADWFTVCLFLVVAGTAYVRAMYPRVFWQLIRSTFNNAIVNQTVREENTLVQRASVLLSINFYVIAALFLYQLSIHFGWSASWLAGGMIRFLFFILVIAFAYSLKLLVLKSMGWLYGADKPVSYYIFNLMLINNLLGLALLPVVLCIAFIDDRFVEPAIWTGIGVAVISFFYRLLRGFSVWRGMTDVSILYIILYFCTLEIIPVLIMGRIVMISWK